MSKRTLINRLHDLNRYHLNAPGAHNRISEAIDCIEELEACLRDLWEAYKIEGSETFTIEAEKRHGENWLRFNEQHRATIESLGEI